MPYPKRDKDNCCIFIDYPNFKPNKTPKEMFTEGIFKGIYFHDIISGLTGKKYTNMHKKYKFLNSIPENRVARPIKDADLSINKYKKDCGTTLEFWTQKGWIKESHPYGWVNWFCSFYSGERCDDDERQIKRWLAFAGPKGRFRNGLIKQIYIKKAKFDDYEVSPVRRQSLLHWAYELTKKDYQVGLKEIIIK